MQLALACYGFEFGVLVGLTVLGIPAVLFGLFWVLDRAGFLPKRYPPGQCRDCGHALGTTAAATCPNCGSLNPPRT